MRQKTSKRVKVVFFAFWCSFNTKNRFEKKKKKKAGLQLF